MIAYWNSHYVQMIQLMVEHGQMVLSALLIALSLAIVIVFFFVQKNNWLNGLTYFFSMLYSIPSYALFALLMPITGLNKTSAIIVLTIYCEYILLRSFITGIKNVDPQYVEAGRGLGMTSRQIFFKVQLPLALPSLFSGMQLALGSTMAIATIASTISAGGLGDLLFAGLQTNNVIPIIWGTILEVVLALFWIMVLQFAKNLLESDEVKK
ncbi:ABC transporter permease [Lactobacillus corticis]|uniref:Glycine betaine/choline ABC transporter permease component n=1 Tax=Lactobacillus corticis TaxID=2201249 RepID=A0A916VIT4_9LACO|nr:ABC transporter permease [Lactobacillus corticis]GFZ27673.1 glycine betaine/choline ABC transporter permease component [Lactobacillus corticis]